MGNTTPGHDKRMAELTFAECYPHYINKIQSKGRTQEEFFEVLEWLTGFEKTEVLKLVESKSTFNEFFLKAKLNPNAKLITGSVCGYKIQDITTLLTKQVRYLDKLVDELAKGKKMEKILRTPK